MLVRDRMSSPVETLGPDTNYHTALRQMQDHGVHHLPVVDADGQLIGIVAERDLLLAASHYLQTAIEVGEVMHKGVLTVTPETPIAEAASIMVKNKIGGLPVMDANKHVIGIITETDIFKAFVEMETAATRK